MGVTTLKIKRQQKLKKTELKHIYFKVLQANNETPFSIRKSIFFLSKIKAQKFSLNQCFITGLSSGVYKPWNLSKFFLRILFTQNCIFGLKKSSW